MTSSFTVRRADGYEQLMGRWSRRLAPLFIDFAQVPRNAAVLDVGCGTGSLALTLADDPSIARIDGIDFSEVFVAAAKERTNDPRISFRQGDACALPYADGSYDCALAMLVLHFIPEPRKAVEEMRRVVKPGGVVAATVWDHLGGMSGMRMMWDTVAMLNEAGRAARHRYLFQPMMRPGELRACFEASGLRDVEETSLIVRFDYASFDDYWAPIAAGEGPLGRYMTTLDAAEQAKAEAAVRDAYAGGEPDGPRSFAGIAWAARGTAA
ncbi:MAG: class I SAM-dependent methyltransferase [Hyphomicrobiales bacterium]